MKGLTLLGLALRRHPLRTLGGLLVEYLGFVSAILFVLFLLLTRVPLRVLDSLTGWEIRRRIIDAIARVSPG